MPSYQNTLSNRQLERENASVQYSLLVALAHLQKFQTPNVTQDATHEIWDKTSQHHHVVDEVDDREGVVGKTAGVVDVMGLLNMFDI